MNDSSKIKIKIPEDSFCTETHIGPTPNGGAYSTAIYSNKGHEPCSKEEACYVEISEYDENGNRINGVYAICGDEKSREFTDEEKSYYKKIADCYDAVNRGMSLRIALYKNGLPEMEKFELIAEYMTGRNAGLI